VLRSDTAVLPEALGELLAAPSISELVINGIRGQLFDSCQIPVARTAVFRIVVCDLQLETADGQQDVLGLAAVRVTVL
jgi:hypothetical protein